jgi:cell division protein FtsL
MRNVGHKTEGHNSPIVGGININNTSETLKSIIDLINKHSSDIEQINEKIEKLSKHKPEKQPYIKLLLWVLFGAIVFFTFAVVLNRAYHFGISDTSVVLAFVGILATFIVVSNYIQMKDLERKIKDLDTKVNDSLTNVENTFKKENNITKLELIGAFMVELVKGLMDGKKYDVILGLLINQTVAYWQLIYLFGKSEEVNIQHLNASFKYIDFVLDNIAKENTEIPWDNDKIDDYLSTLENDSRFERIRNFLINKRGENNQL